MRLLTMWLWGEESDRLLCVRREDVQRNEAAAAAGMQPSEIGRPATGIIGTVSALLPACLSVSLKL